MTWSWWRFAGIVCLGAAATASAWSQDHVIRTTPLMFHGQPNPDLPGWTIGAPANATISPEGRIMFVASTNPMEGGPGLGAAFTLIDGVISTVMQTGELIGQHPEIVCTNFLPPWRVFDDRSVMLLAVWSAGRALVTGQPGDLRIVAMSGSDSNPDPDYAHVVSIASPLRTASGHMAFTGYQKVWATVPGTGEFAVLLEEGDAVPGYEDTTYVDCFAKGVLADGRVIVGVEFEGSGLPIWEETVAIGNPATGEVVPLYGAGLPLPGVKGPGIRVAFAPIITGDGIIAFNAVFVDDKPPGESLGIWIGPLDDPTLVMRIGQPAPAMPGATFGGIYGSPILSPSGHAAIIAFAGGEGYPVTSSLFYWDGHQLLFRATRGTPIDNRPGMTVQAILSQAATLMINSNDFLIFESMVYVSSNSWRPALLAAWPDGTLSAIAVDEMPVQVGPGDCRVVDGWHFYSAGLNAVRNGDDGFGTAFNNAGQFVYTLTFTDGTIGLFMSEFETRCVADLDTNGVVNSADLAILLASWSDACSPVDLDGDGTVGPGDLAMLLNRWGACPEF